MKILLINNNPVVSRLTALSARKENIEIDEVQEVTELKSNAYDIVFVDDDSWSKDVEDIVKEHIETKKTVLFYAEGDNEHKDAFDIAILKPFLPSEVSTVIRSLDEIEEDENNFDILAESKELERDELFDFNESASEKVSLVSEAKKDVTIDSNEKLEDDFPLNSVELEDDLFVDKVEDKKETVENKVSEIKENEALFDLDLNDDNLSLEDDLFSKEEPALEMTDDKSDKEDKLEEEISTLVEKKSEKELENSLVLENDATVSTETKILDKGEIDNIKGLLSEDVDTNELTLDDLMSPAPLISIDSTETKDEKVTTKVETSSETKAEQGAMNMESNVLMETIASLPVEKLRELLAGASVNISIQFPKA